MRDLEDELRWLLRREEPDANFTRRLLDRIGQAEKRRRWLHFMVPRAMPRWAGAVALACALVVIASYAGYRTREQRRGEMARAEALRALRITSAELNATFQRALLKSSSRISQAEERSARQ